MLVFAAGGRNCKRHQEPVPGSVIYVGLAQFRLEKTPWCPGLPTFFSSHPNNEKDICSSLLALGVLAYYGEGILRPVVGIADLTLGLLQAPTYVWHGRELSLNHRDILSFSSFFRG